MRATLYLDVAADPERHSSCRRASPGTSTPSTASTCRCASTAPTFLRTSLAVVAPGNATTIVAPQGARYVVIGGAPLDGPRFIWWNFVSSSKERIEQAKPDWTAQRMGTIPGEHEWIPLP